MMPSEEPERSLVVVVCGREGAGKTLLVNHLAHALSPEEATHLSLTGEPCESRTTALANVRNLSPGPKWVQFLRVSRQAAATFLRLAWRRVQRKRFKLYNVREFAAPPHAQIHLRPFPNWIIVDSYGRSGVLNAARDFVPDVVLFVTRLDETRAARCDKEAMESAECAFGENVWDRTIFVLSHGNSLPPADLTYHEFVRGRRDALWRSITLIVPPCIRKSTSGASKPTDSERMIAFFRANARRNRVAQADTSTQGGDQAVPVDGTNEIAETAFLREIARPDFASAVLDPFSYLEQQSFTEVGSHVHSRGAGSMPDGGLHRLLSQSPTSMRSAVLDESVLLDDPPPPEVVVSEMSNACPRNLDGEKTVPDGTPWVSELLGEIQRVAHRVHNSGVRRLKGGLYQDSRAPKSRKDILRDLSRKGILVLCLESALSVVLFGCLGAWASVIKRQSGQLQAKRGDMVCKINQGEADKLERVDAEPDPQFEDGYHEADEYFFGRDDADANEKGGKSGDEDGVVSPDAPSDSMNSGPADRSSPGEDDEDIQV